MDRQVRIGEASARTGLTAKQLRHLEGIGLVQAQWIGSHRGYGEREIESVRLLKALMDRDPRFTPERISWPLGLAGRPWEDVPELRSYWELRPRKVDCREAQPERYRSLLKAALGAVQRIEVGEEFQTYNSTYKRLKRLGREMGLSVVLRKRGEFLDVSTIAFPRAGPPAGIRKRRRERPA